MKLIAVGTHKAHYACETPSQSKCTPSMEISLFYSHWKLPRALNVSISWKSVRLKIIVKTTVILNHTKILSTNLNLDYDEFLSNYHASNHMLRSIFTLKLFKMRI